MAGMRAGSLIAGLSPSGMLAIAIAGITVTGIMNPITNGPLQASLLSLITPDKQGRTFTLVSTLARATSPLGMAVAGPVADRFGTQVWFAVGGVACTLMDLALRTISAIHDLAAGTPAPAIKPCPQPEPAAAGRAN